MSPWTAFPLYEYFRLLRYWKRDERMYRRIIDIGIPCTNILTQSNDAPCVSRQCGPKICCVYNKILFRSFFSVPCALPVNSGWFGAALGNAHYKREDNMDLVATFCLLTGTSVINFALLGRNRNTLNKRRHQNYKANCIPNVCHRELLEWRGRRG